MTGTSEKCIACYPKMEQGIQPQCFVNCIGKIRLAGYLSKPDQAKPENPIDYLVHVRKLALPLFPQYGLEPNVYYIPPIHAPLSFNEQLFGPGAGAAMKTYRTAATDLDLAGLLCLLGSTDMVVSKWRRQGETISGLDDKGAELVKVPLREPVHVRPGIDPKLQIIRTNCP
jgi:nitrate reductase beta subunit